MRPNLWRRSYAAKLQEILELEMTEHIGAEPHERTEKRRGHRNVYRPRTLTTRVDKLNLLVPREPEGHLLHQALCPLPKKREGARTLPHGDVRTGGIHPQGDQDNRGALR